MSPMLKILISLSKYNLHGPGRRWCSLTGGGLFSAGSWKARIVQVSRNIPGLLSVSVN